MVFAARVGMLVFTIEEPSSSPAGYQLTGISAAGISVYNRAGSVKRHDAPREPGAGIKGATGVHRRPLSPRPARHRGLQDEPSAVSWVLSWL